MMFIDELEALAEAERQRLVDEIKATLAEFDGREYAELSDEDFEAEMLGVKGRVA